MKIDPANVSKWKHKWRIHNDAVWDTPIHNTLRYSSFSVQAIAIVIHIKVDESRRTLREETSRLKAITYQWWKVFAKNKKSRPWSDNESVHLYFFDAGVKMSIENRKSDRSKDPYNQCIRSRITFFLNIIPFRFLIFLAGMCCSIIVVR